MSPERSGVRRELWEQPRGLKKRSHLPSRQEEGGRERGRCAWQRQQQGEGEGREFHCVLKVRM